MTRTIKQVKKDFAARNNYEAMMFFWLFQDEICELPNHELFVDEPEKFELMFRLASSAEN